MNILVVDDEKEIADVIALYLQNDEYQVHKFYTGEEALNCIETTKIDLALLDVMLPDMDGFTLCRKDSGKAPVPHHHADRQNRGRGQDHRLNTGGRRLYHQAVQSAGSHCTR